MRLINHILNNPMSGYHVAMSHCNDACFLISSHSPHVSRHFKSVKLLH